MPLTWTEDAPTMVGKVTLVELQHVDARGRVLLFEHMWGEITRVDRSAGIFVDLKGAHAGRDLALPADLDRFTRANRGLYKLESTGEEIEDPDFLSTWTLQHKDQVGL